MPPPQALRAQVSKLGSDRTSEWCGAVATATPAVRVMHTVLPSSDDRAVPCGHGGFSDSSPALAMPKAQSAVGNFCSVLLRSDGRAPSTPRHSKGQFAQLKCRPEGSTHCCMMLRAPLACPRTDRTEAQDSRGSPPHGSPAARMPSLQVPRQLGRALADRLGASKLVV